MIDMNFKKRIILELILLLFVLILFIYNRQGYNLFKANSQANYTQTAQSYHSLAKSFIAQRRYEEAEDAAFNALAIDSSLTKAYIDLGCIYTDTANFIKAERFFQQALKYIGDDRINREVVYYNLGVVYEREKQTGKSWKYYRKAYRLKSFLQQAWKNNARFATYYVIKNDKTGFKNYVDAADSPPKEVLWVNAKLKFDLLLHRYQKVAIACRQYLYDNAHSRYSYLFLECFAAASLGMGDYATADSILTKLNSLSLSDKDEKWLNQMRIYSLFKQQRFDEALKYLNNVSIGGDRESLEYTLYWKAIIHKARNDLIGEKTALRQLIGNFPESKLTRWAHIQLSAIYSKLGNYLGSYEEIIKSKILGAVAILEFISIVIMAAIFTGILALFFRIFFRKKVIENKINPGFKKSDLFIFFIFFLITPWFVYLVFLYLNYHFNSFFNFLHLNPVLAANVTSQCFLMLVCLFFLKRKYKLDNASLGFISRGYKYNFLLPLAVTVISILILLAFVKLIYLLGIKPPPPSQLKYLVHNIVKKQSILDLIYLFIAGSIIIPLTEEIIFRVYLLNFFKKHSNTLCAVIFNTLCFALSHETLLFAPYFILMGIILSVIYLRTKSIIPCVVTHALYNFLIISLGVTTLILRY